MRSLALTCAAVLIAICPVYGQEMAKTECKPVMKQPCKPKARVSDTQNPSDCNRDAAAPATSCGAPAPASTLSPCDLFKRGEPISADTTTSGYAFPARIDTQDWDFFIGGAFTFWYAAQDGMDLAVSSSFNSAAAPTFFLPADASTLFQKFSYKPGFKLALGGGSSFDNWTYAAHYTWVRSHTVTSSDRPPAPPLGVGASGDWRIQNWMPLTTNINALSLNSSWKLGMDLADLQLSRPYYLGTNLTVEPFFGGQGGWIRQALRLSYNAISSNTATNPVPHNPIVTHAKSQCWGIGPRIGMNANWLMGAGFRFIGAAEANLLYTSYRTVALRSDKADSTAGSNAQNLKISRLNVVRPNAGLSLGMGWGMYADRNRWHFDLSASYDFYAYFSQNMMRYLVDLTSARTGASPGNLYLQGLTTTARFDF